MGSNRDLTLLVLVCALVPAWGYLSVGSAGSLRLSSASPFVRIAQHGDLANLGVSLPRLAIASAQRTGIGGSFCDRRRGANSRTRNGIHNINLRMRHGGEGEFRGLGNQEEGGEIFTNNDTTTDWENLSKIFVLLFNPRSDNEGIYTLQIKRRDGQLVNTIVLFEDTEDAQRYSGLLEAQDFPSASVEVIAPIEIKEFASSAGYQTTFIPKGTLFMPPENNVADRPWNPNGEAREGQRAGTESEASEFAADELEQIRKRFERMFGEANN